MVKPLFDTLDSNAGFIFTVILRLRKMQSQNRCVVHIKMIVKFDGRSSSRES